MYVYPRKSLPKHSNFHFDDFWPRRLLGVKLAPLVAPSSVPCPTPAKHSEDLSTRFVNLTVPPLYLDRVQTSRTEAHTTFRSPTCLWDAGQSRRVLYERYGHNQTQCACSSGPEMGAVGNVLSAWDAHLWWSSETCLSQHDHRCVRRVASGHDLVPSRSGDVGLLDKI